MKGTLARRMLSCGWKCGDDVRVVLIFGNGMLPICLLFIISNSIMHHIIEFMKGRKLVIRQGAGQSESRLFD